LYHSLLSALADQDLHRAYALIALPNDASLKLHHRFDFQQVAHLNGVGRKFQRYWDVVWLEKHLSQKAIRTARPADRRFGQPVP